MELRTLKNLWGSQWQEATVLFVEKKFEVHLLPKRKDAGASQAGAIGLIGFGVSFLAMIAAKVHQTTDPAMAYFFWVVIGGVVASLALFCYFRPNVHTLYVNTPPIEGEDVVFCADWYMEPKIKAVKTREEEAKEAEAIRTEKRICNRRSDVPKS